MSTRNPNNGVSEQPEQQSGPTTPRVFFEHCQTIRDQFVEQTGQEPVLWALSREQRIGIAQHTRPVPEGVWTPHPEWLIDTLWGMPVVPLEVFERLPKPYLIDGRPVVVMQGLLAPQATIDHPGLAIN